MSTDLITKYRPQKWEDVLGQGSVAQSVCSALRGKKARNFLFTGPSGVGKTTLARLVAQELGIDLNSPSYLELDAATNTGIDDMRRITASLIMLPMGSNGSRVICLDEAHMLSKAAWNSLLKDIEEPPPGVHWVLCTTEASKVPAAVRTRCLEYDLKPLGDKSLLALLGTVSRAEKLKIDSDTEDMLLEAAGGSARGLLAALAKIQGCKTPEESARVLEVADLESNKDVADFCRALMGHAKLDELVSILSKMEGVSAEGVRNVVCAWFSKVVLNSKGDRAKRDNGLDILSAFGDPYPPCGSSLHPVLLSLRRLTEIK